MNDAEADYVVFRLKEITKNPLAGDYDYEHLMRMHEYIFQDLYDWAGIPRVIQIYKEEDVLGGMSIEYSDPFDIQHDIRHVLNDMKNKIWDSMSLEVLAQEF